MASIYLTETRRKTYTRLEQSETGTLPTPVPLLNRVGSEKEVELETYSSSDKDSSVSTSGENGDNGNAEVTETDEGVSVALVDGGTFSKTSALRKWIAERIEKLGMLKDRNVLLSVGLYAFYGFTSSTYGEVLPLFALLPVNLGGMGFDTDQIGNLSTIAGATIILFNLLFYHKIVHRVGLIRTFQIGTASLVILHMLTAEIPRWTLQRSAENFFIIPHFDFWMLITFSSFLFWCSRQMQLTSLMQLINNCVTPRDMGAVNGLAQSTVALTRMFAPTFGSTVLAWSVSVNNYYFLTSRFVFFVLGLLSLVMVAITKKLDRALNKPKLWDM